MKFRFLEAFFESAPQCILQIHIILMEGEANKYHLISLGISSITFSWFCAMILFPRNTWQRLANFFLVIICSVPRLASWALLTSTSKPYTIVYFIGDVFILAPIMMCLPDMTFPRALYNTITSLIGPMTSLFVKDGENHEANFIKYFTATSIAHIVNQMINLSLVIFVWDDLPELLHCHQCSYDLFYFYAAITAVTGALILSIGIAACIYGCLINSNQDINQTDYELRPMRI
jgi:hypothetical protein